MIDLQNETVISFGDAPAHLPRRRRGKKTHVATLYRWAQRGVRGVKLESLQVGGTRCTSIEAIQRFCERLTKPTTVAASQTRSARERGITAAERELAAEGIS